MTNYNDGKWHGWNGGECPVHPESVVDYVWRDITGETGFYGSCKAGVWDCNDARPNWNTIIAFRVSKEHKEPREFWICRGHVFQKQVIADAYGSICDGAEIIHVREVL